jgi:hypothetical protein
VAIEGTATHAREKSERLRGRVDTDLLARAARFLVEPGISVVNAALAAGSVGEVVPAMHDPMEGRLAIGLFELVARRFRASGNSLAHSRVSRNLHNLPCARARSAETDCVGRVANRRRARRAGLGPDAIETTGIPVVVLVKCVRRTRASRS